MASVPPSGSRAVSQPANRRAANRSRGADLRAWRTTRWIRRTAGTSKNCAIRLRHRVRAVQRRSLTIVVGASCGTTAQASRGSCASSTSRSTSAARSGSKAHLATSPPGDRRKARQPSDATALFRYRGTIRRIVTTSCCASIGGCGSSPRLIRIVRTAEASRSDPSSVRRLRHAFGGAHGDDRRRLGMRRDYSVRHLRPSAARNRSASRGPHSPASYCGICDSPAGRPALVHRRDQLPGSFGEVVARKQASNRRSSRPAAASRTPRAPRLRTSCRSGSAS